jgi:spore coat protein JB
MDPKQLQMLRELMELEFVATELTLYLDTHPDKEAPLRHYNAVAGELTYKKRVYEAAYGPLFSFGFSPSQYPWQWIKGPWPWEIKY